MLRGLPSGKRKDGGQGTRATPPRWLLRRLPEPRAPPSSLPRTPEVSLPLAHLLHVCAR